MGSNVFMTCSEYAIDEFWKKVFIDCAKGKFPYCIRYKANTNCLYYKGGASERLILSNDPKEVFSQVINFFQDKLGMYSSLDTKKRRERMELSKDDGISTDCSWNDIKPIILKSEFLMDFVFSKCKELNLSNSESVLMYNEITKLISQKLISSDDINYHNGKVLSIDGICITKNGVVQTQK